VKVASLLLVAGLLAPASAPAWTGETWGPITRATIKSIADEMIDSSWVPKNTFTNYQYGSTYQKYTGGVTYKGIAYSQNNPQETWAEFHGLVTNTAGGQTGYGNDCSGFVSICWKLKSRNTTRSFESGLNTYWTALGDIGSAPTVSLLPGDGINSSSNGHIIMFLKYEGAGIRSMEQTPDNAQRRAWSYSSLAKYRPIRRMDIQETPIEEPPGIQSDLLSRAVTAGDPLTLSVNANGTNLFYRWFLNGNLIPGAAANSLALGMAHLTNTGLYHCIVSNAYGSATSRTASVTVWRPQTTVFLDSFDTNSISQWTINRSSEDTGASFSFDYSAMGIPPAPASISGTTRGLRLEANMTMGAIAALSLSPKNRSFPGDHRLRFDMWINANGPLPEGGTGSTESLTAGIGTAGNRLQWNGPDSIADGFWFLANGEGGSTDTSTTQGDFCAFIGSMLQNPSSGCYAAGTDSTAKGNSNTYYTSMFPGGTAPPTAQAAAFPQQTGALAAGAAGFAWRDVVIAKRGSTVDWIMDGILIATVTNAAFTASNVFVGYFDTYASVSDNPDLSFGLVDNVRVEMEAVPPSISILALPNGRLQITGNGRPGHYALQATEDFVHWTQIANSICGEGVFQHIENNPAPARRFYRLCVLP